jgi:hypothetical protein
LQGRVQPGLSGYKIAFTFYVIGLIGVCMKLPEIGEVINSDRAIELCRHFELEYLVERIEANPDAYTDWKFDGVSGVPEKLAAFFTGVDEYTLTYECALPHDLCYAYGEHGNEIEKQRVDMKFHSDLLTKARMNKFFAELFYKAVRIGGVEELGLSFSWAFASPKKPKG